MRRKLAAGNWKMNGTREALSELTSLADAHPSPACEILICPPATLLAPAHDTLSGTSVALGGQDCHMSEKGAHTGDLSAAMLKEAGAQYVILGHSERRQNHGEYDAMIRAKALAAMGQDLCAIVCIGESEAERDAGDTLAVLGTQLGGSVPDDITADQLIVAYEPIWAIGTGKVATLDQIREVHAFLRAELKSRFGDAIGDQIALLYGGSVKPDNAADIFAVENVDGALVGGASLKAADFSPIISALASST